MSAGNNANPLSYAVVGFTNGQAVKYNNNLSPIWSNTSLSTNLRAVFVDYNEFVYVANNNILRKLNSSGTEIWQYTYTANINDIYVTENGEVFFVSLNNLVKLSSNGNLINDVGTPNFTEQVFVNTFGDIVALGNSNVMKWDSNLQLIFNVSNLGNGPNLSLDSNNDIHVAGSQGIAKLSGIDGSSIWHNTTFSHNGLDIDQSGFIYSATTTRRLIKYNPVDGNIIWNVEASPNISPFRLTIDETGLIYMTLRTSTTYQIKTFDNSNGNNINTITNNLFNTVIHAPRPYFVSGPPYRINFNSKQVINIIKDGKEVTQIYKGFTLLS